MLNFTEQDLTTLNTFGVAVNAKNYLKIRSTFATKKLIETGRLEESKFTILGGGSNLLFTYNPEGLVLHVAVPGLRIIKDEKDHVLIEAGSGVVWHDVVEFAVKNRLGGLENLALIPGFCGAAPIQNIGAYGAEIKDVFDHLTAINIKTGHTEIFNKTSCEFGYRTSVFKTKLKDKYIITRIVLKLNKKYKTNTSYKDLQNYFENKNVVTPGIKEVFDAVIEIRSAKLPNPNEVGNAGSFFKNPVISTKEFENLKKKFPEIPGYDINTGQVKVPAAWLIEQCGWKGKSKGNVGTWPNQALVIVNNGNATGLEILKFAKALHNDVKKKFGITLEPEVNIIGSEKSLF